MRRRVSCGGDRLLLRRLLLGRQLLAPEFVAELVDRDGELEGQLVAIVDAVPP